MAVGQTSGGDKTEVFIGVEEALSYSEEGLRTNPCLAVDLAMLGVGTIDECHATLVSSGISTAEGLSQIPNEGAELEVNGQAVVLGGARAWFKVGKLIEDSTAQFEDGGGAIVAVKLDENDLDDEAMHLILLAGQFVKDGEDRAMLVGDSLKDGMQRQSIAELDVRLQRTLDWAGALFSHHVSVNRGSEVVR